jgi:hypothetical protein
VKNRFQDSDEIKRVVISHGPLYLKLAAFLRASRLPEEQSAKKAKVTVAASNKYI